MEIDVPKTPAPKKKDAPLNALAPTWDKRTMRMLVVGQSGGGKSVMVANLVRRYLPWDTLTVVAKHLGGQLYDDLKADVEKHEERLGRPVSVWADTLADLPPLDAYTPDNKNLVWIDDMMNEPKKDQLPVVEMFTSGRHRNIAVIYCAQSYGRVPADIKRNASCVCIYKGFSAGDVEQLWKDHGGVLSKKAFHAYLMEATKEPHSFAVIDEQASHAALRYRIGWDTLYLP